MTTACVRSRAPSFASRLETCVFTVSCETTSYAAISPFVRPAEDLLLARAIFAPDVRYVVPGTSPMSGTYTGPDAVMGYFARLGELTGGTYAITRMHWATSAERVALLTRNVAERGGRSLAWDECIVLRFEDGVKKAISHFSGDEYGVDELFS